MPASPRGRPVRVSTTRSSSLDAAASGSESTSGMPLSPPSRSRLSIGTCPSSGTSAPSELSSSSEPMQTSCASSQRHTGSGVPQ